MQQEVDPLAQWGSEAASVPACRDSLEDSAASEGWMTLPLKASIFSCL